MAITGLVETAKAAGVEPVTGWFSFRPNGASDPDLTLLAGPLRRYVSSITYSATGIQSIVFTSDFTFGGPVDFAVTNSFDSAGTIHVVTQRNVYDATTRTLIVQTLSGALAAFAAPANANNVIKVRLLADLSTAAT